MFKKALFAATCLAAIPAMAAAQDADLVSASAEDTDAGYEIRWTVVPYGAPVDVYMSDNPQTDRDDMTLVAENDLDGGVTVETDNASRPYFAVVSETGETLRAAERILPLEGGRNFRDLGGYATENGTHVKWGMLYRSGVMTEITTEDYAYLSDLGIRVVCDFRSTEERAEEPTDWQAGNIDYISWDYAMDHSGFRDAFSGGDVSPEKMRAVMTGFYGQIHEEFGDRYREMFSQLIEGNVPLAFNCSAGKDRTGVAAALILYALEVPMETIVADYAMSDDIVDYMAEMREDQAEMAENGEADSQMAFFARLPPEVVSPLMASDPAYIKAMFAAVEAEYGSVDAYLEDRLDVDAADRERLISTLTE